MEEKKKSILIDEELHKELKEFSKHSGISIKSITEMGIRLMFKRIKFPDIEE